MTAARSHKGSAKPTTLAGGISNTATSFTVATGGGTGYPDGSGGVFIVTLDALNASEEKILCSARTGDTFTVSGGGRGYDDTTATSHVNNASVRHTFSAIEASEANAHILASTGVHGIADTSLLLTAAAGNAAYQALAGPQYAAVITGETTASTSFTDLTTAGPAVTVVVGASGRVKVTIGAALSNSLAGSENYMHVALTSGNTRAAANNDAENYTFLASTAGYLHRASRTFVISGLAPGSTVFTAKYRVTGGTGTFGGRTLLVEPI